MMAGWNSTIWFYIVIGLTALVLLTILIVYLKNKNSEQEISTEISDKPVSEPTTNEGFQDGISKFCPGCGAKIGDLSKKYCSICGTQI